MSQENQVNYKVAIANSIKMHFHFNRYCKPVKEQTGTITPLTIGSCPNKVRRSTSTATNAV